MSVFDWLGNTAPPTNADWLSDETPAVSKAVAVVPPDVDEKRLAFAHAFRKLNFTQRIYIRALIECGFVRELARKAVQKQTGVMPSPTQVKSWEGTQKVTKALILASEMAGVYLDPVSNMIRLNHVIESTLTPRDRYAGGEATGEKEIAAGDALRGIELAAKINKQLRDDGTVANRVTVVINLADDKPEGPIVSEQ